MIAISASATMACFKQVSDRWDSSSEWNRQLGSSGKTASAEERASKAPSVTTKRTLGLFSFSDSSSFDALETAIDKPRAFSAAVPTLATRNATQGPSPFRPKAVTPHGNFCSCLGKPRGQFQRTSLRRTGTLSSLAS